MIMTTCPAPQQFELEEYDITLDQADESKIKRNVRVYSSHMRCHGQILGVYGDQVCIAWGMRIFKNVGYGCGYATGTLGYSKGNRLHMDHVFLAE